MFEPAVIQPSPPERPWRSRWRRARANLRRSAPFVSGIIAAFLGMWLFGVIAPGPRALTPADVRTGVQDVLASITPRPAFSSIAYERARPSVVRIQTAIAPTGPSPSPSHEDAIGTGVVVDERARGAAPAAEPRGRDRDRGGRRRARRHPDEPPRRRRRGLDHRDLRRRLRVAGPDRRPAAREGHRRPPSAHDAAEHPARDAR